MIGVKIDGGKEIAAALEGLSKRISRKVATEALLTGGELIRRSAERRAPKDDEAPHLRDNIEIAPTRKGVASNEVGVGIGVPKAFYYDFMREFGIRGPVQPFYRPALDENGEKAIELIGHAFWTELAGRGISRSVVGSDSTPEGEV